MNKKTLVLVALFLLLLLPTALSAPTVTVTHPNGGELLSGTSTIDFTVSDNTVVNVLDANICLTFTPGFCDQQTVGANLDLFDYCDFDLETNWQLKDTMVTSLGGDHVTAKSTFFFEDSAYHVLYWLAETGAGKTLVSETWDGSQWVHDSDYNSGLIAKNPVDGHFSVFHLGTDLYALDGGSNTIRGYKYDSGTDAWLTDSDINAGLPAVGTNFYGAYPVEDYLNKDWIITRVQSAGVASIKSFFWDSGVWVNNDYLASNFKIFDYSEGANLTMLRDATFFQYNSELYSLQRYDTYPAADPWKGRVAGAFFDTSPPVGWKSVLDFNSINPPFIPDDGFGASGVYFDNLIIDSNLTMFFSRTTDVNHYVYESAFNTLETKTCSYPWDTTLSQNGSWYIDVNVTNSLNEFDLDSSDNLFNIINWTIDDIQCECVSNCSSCTPDVNTFEVTPTNKGLDVQIKITNGEGLKNPGFRILNSNNNGNQYKVHFSNSTEYSSGIWNYSSGLTFGTDNYDSMQKLWDSDNARYNYFFQDSILSSEVKYYKFEYYSPAYHFFSVIDPLWDNEFAPQSSDSNGLQTDIFQTSFYANIGSTLTEPKFPSITTDATDSANYVLQFTAKESSDGNGFIRAGTIPNLLSSAAPSDTIDLITGFKTITVDTISNGYVKIDSNSISAKTIRIQNYAITERGFFTKNLEVLDKDGTSLPVYIDAGRVYEYISEGQQFRVKTQYLDANGKIDRFEISAYIDQVADFNKVKTWIFDANQTGLIDIDLTLEGLVDLIASAPNRNVKITTRLIDDSTGYYEIQSKFIKLIQFPYFAGDFSINTIISNKQVGKHPKGEIMIRTKNPNTLRGVRYYLYQRAGSPDRSDYNKTFFKDVDFTCQGFDCSFEYEIEDWLFPTEDHYSLTVSALLSTENEDHNSSLTAKTIYFRVYWREFETSRVLETFERNLDHTYRDDEEISITLQIREADYANIKEDLDVWLTLWNCDAAADTPDSNCMQQDLNYRPDQFLYDVETGYNYYFWKQVFINEDGTILDDTNYYRFMATVSDAQGLHGSTKAIYPLLTSKCQDYDTDCTDDGDVLAVTSCFIANAFAFLNRAHFISPCQTVSPPIVTIGTNDANEQRILIDASKALTAPTHECHFCFNSDTNNIYLNQLEQELVCGSWYTFNEAPIDSFKFHLTNENSDFAKKGSDAQYLTFEIPYSQIAFNDIRLIREALSIEYGTRADTIGELIEQIANKLYVGYANQLTETPEGQTADGIITDMGLDCNFDRVFDPTHLGGIVFYKMKGIKVINQQDLIPTYPELEGVDSKDLIEYMNYKGYPVPESETTIEYYIGNLDKVIATMYVAPETFGTGDAGIRTSKIPSPLVINEVYSETSIRQENIEGETVNYETLPTYLKFVSVADLVYNSERSVIRRVAPFTISAVIEQQGTTATLIFSGIISNWAFILIGLSALIVIGVIYRLFRGRGNQGGE